VTNREAARMLGVSLETLTAVRWKYRPMLRGTGRRVRHPNRGLCNIYPLEQIERISAAQAEAAAARPQIPEGFVDKDGACRFFGVTRHTWKKWVNQGKVRCGRIIPSPVGHRLTIYAIADLQRMREELFGEDKLYKGSDNQYHVPADLIRREEAWERFGVGIGTWQRWEREGVITCGARVPAGPKLYKLQDIERLLEEYGKFSPPYPDPDRPGVYRVPLSGRDIQRREALIDAADLSLIEGRSCAWSTGDAEVGFVSLNSNAGGGGPLRRVIMGVTEAGLNVRHVNGDPLDCRRANLVVRTIKQRTRNMRKAATHCGQPCTSRFKGVFWEWRTKRWRAAIHVARKKRNLGRFHDELAAAQAYDEAARELFGEHARLNFPDGIDAWLDSQQSDRAEAA
jgi:transposase